MAQHNDIGKYGEQLATDYLIAQGYAIVDRNVKIGFNELDIVAMHGDRIVFVEVKTRSEGSFDALQALDARKLQHLCRAANAYVRAYGVPHDVQLDVITIDLPRHGEPIIEHYPDAVMPPMSGR